MENIDKDISFESSNFIKKLKTRFNDLRKSEQRVVKYIMKNPLEILDMTINELAKKSDCSDATVVRACNNLDFNGFQDLKFSLKQDIENNLNRVYEEIEEDDGIEDLIKKVFRANAKAIDDTLEILDFRNMGKALDKLKKANNIALFAQGGATPVATDFYHGLINLGIQSIWQPDSNMQLISSEFMREGDVCIAISRSGEIKDVVDATKIARKGGAYCIGITAVPNSPLDKATDLTMYTSVQNQVFRNIDNSHRVALLTILDSLYIGLASEDHQKTKEALILSTKATSSKRIVEN